MLALAVPLGADELGDALTARRFADVVRLADARLREQPRDARVWTIRGMALEGLQRLPESLASFERALAIDPHSLAALQGATQVAYRSRNPKAPALLGRVLARDPANETAHAMAGVLAVEAGRCDKAVEHFGRSGAALDTNRIAATEYGGCLLRLNRIDAAVAVFERLVQEHDADPDAHYNLALAMLQAGRAADAVTHASAAMAVRPRDPDVLNLFAAASAAAGRIEPAIAALRTAIEVAPGEERHYLDLAVICLDHDAADLAMEVVSAGLARIPASPRLYTMRGAIHADRAELDAAMHDFERAQALGPDALYGAVGVSLVLRQTDRTAEAVALLRQKLAKEPRNPTLNYLLADALTRNDPEPASPEFREARAALNRALRADPRLGRAHAALGKLYLRDGNAAAAVKELSAALDLDPDDRLALNQLVIAYRQLGRSSDAAAAAERLKAVLARDRSEEVARNRVRLVRKTEPAEDARR